MPYIYFLRSEKDQEWYIGKTARSIDDRFHEHTSGHVRSTKNRRPLRLAYYEFMEESRVHKREWFLKSTRGYKEKLKIVDYLIKHQEQWPIAETFEVKT